MTRSGVEAGPLGDAVSRHLGSVHSIQSLGRLSGGASRETWSFEAVALDGTRVPLILRREPPPEAAIAAPIDECTLIEVAGAVGVPVAPLRFRLNEEDGIGAGFVSDFVEGETLGKRIVHDATYASARSGLAAECGRILALLHTVPIEETGLAVPSLEARSGRMGLRDRRRRLRLLEPEYPDDS